MSSAGKSWRQASSCMLRESRNERRDIRVERLVAYSMSAINSLISVPESEEARRFLSDHNFRASFKDMRENNPHKVHDGSSDLHQLTAPQESRERLTLGD